MAESIAFILIEENQILIMRYFVAKPGYNRVHEVCICVYLCGWGG